MNNDGCGLRSQYSKHLDHCQTPDCQTLRGLHNAARHLMEPATMEEDHNPIQTVCMVHGMANIQHRIDPCDGARSLRSHKINRRSRHQSPYHPPKEVCASSWQWGPSSAGAHGPFLALRYTNVVFNGSPAVNINQCSMQHAASFDTNSLRADPCGVDMPIRLERTIAVAHGSANRLL